jgi:hypothetical protein
MTPESGVPRICQEAQAQLPAFVAGTLPRWRRRLVDLHLRRCADCRAALEREREVAAGLDALGAATADAVEGPPAGLLDTLLEQAQHPGVRGRAAIPARGAVSGARPSLSVALLVVAAAAGTALGYASWRGARAVTGRVQRSRAGRIG